MGKKQVIKSWVILLIIVLPIVVFTTSTCHRSVKSTELLAAAQTGDTTAISAILADPVDVNIEDEFGYTALHWAALGGYMDIVNLLLEHGADVNHTSRTGETSLMMACMNKHSEVVAVLLLAGAQPNIQPSGSPGWYAIHYASGAGSLETVELLIEANANLAAQDEYGRAPLHFAANSDIALALLKAGADPNAIDDSGTTPLHCACIDDQADVVEVLLQAGAHVNAAIQAGWMSAGQTPLHTAVKSGAISSIEKLIASGADIDAQDLEGETPLHLAAQEDQLDAAKALLNAGADSSITNADGKTPLDLAVTLGYSEIVDLIRAGN